MAAVLIAPKGEWFWQRDAVNFLLTCRQFCEELLTEFWLSGERDTLSEATVSRKRKKKSLVKCPVHVR